MSAVFIGHKTVVSPDCGTFISEPKAPKNYKDQAKIDAYIEEAKAEILSASSSKPFTGMFQEASLCFYNSSANSFECVGTFKGAEGLPQFLENLEKLVISNTQAFIFQAKAFMQLVCMQALRAKINNKFVVKWLLNHPDRAYVVDLPKIFLPTQEEVSRIGYINMFNYFGVPLTQSDMDNTVTQATKLYELYCAVGKFNHIIPGEISEG